MSDEAAPGAGRRIPLQLAGDCVVASIQVDLDESTIQRFQTELLDQVRASGARGVILDLSGLQVLDRDEFEALRRTTEMTAIMGATPVVCGLRPGVVGALIELDADVDGIHAARDLDDAFVLMNDLHGGDEESLGHAGWNGTTVEPDADHD